MKPKFICQIASLFFFLIHLVGCYSSPQPQFDGENAKEYVEIQLQFGPRYPGSKGSDSLKDFLENELKSFGWIVERQDFSLNSISMTNVIGKSSIEEPDIIFGTHFDTRLFSDNEPSASLQTIPVPGANDGASGTAVLLEMARVLSKKEKDIWIVFFDGEDQGYINDWDWSIGAEYFVEQLSSYPENVIIIDMIGDADLNIFKEEQSSVSLTNTIWEEAKLLGFEKVFINSYKYALLDDHTPFLEKGIPACLIIDFDYPYWHTSEDTIDKISSQSLETIGNVLLSWLSNQSDLNGKDP